MSHEFILYTEAGKPDSLTHEVKLAFTLTPPKLKGYSCGFDPVALACESFSDGASETFPLQWSSNLAFSTYRSEVMSNGRKDCSSDANPQIIMPGQLRVMEKPGSQVVWSNPTSPEHRSAFQKSSAMIVNDTKSAQSIALRIEDLGDPDYFTCVAYRPLMDGERIVVPQELLLQVYVVSAEVLSRDILAPEDCEYPLFTMPIPCKALSPSSKWKLCQDSHGDIQLISDAQPEMGHQSIETLTRSYDDIKAQLATVLKALEDNQDRLLVMERSIIGIQKDLVSGQQAMTEMRTNRTQVEAKLSKLAGSFGQSQTRVLTVQNVVTDTRRNLSALENAVSTAQKQLPDFAAVETKTNARLSTLEESAGRSGGILETVQDALTKMQQSQAALENAVNTAESKLEDFTAIEGKMIARLTTLEESVDRTGDDLSALQNAIAERPRTHPVVENTADAVKDQLPDFTAMATKINCRLSKLEECATRTQDDLSTVQQLVVATSQLSLMTNSAPDPPVARNSADSTKARNLDDNPPAIQARVNELSVSAKADVLAIRKDFQAMDRRVPVVEERAGKLENQLGRTREELSGFQQLLALAGDQIARLDSRVKGGGQSTPSDNPSIIPPAGSNRSALRSSARSGPPKDKG